MKKIRVFDFSTNCIAEGTVYLGTFENDLNTKEFVRVGNSIIRTRDIGSILLKDVEDVEG